MIRNGLFPQRRHQTPPFLTHRYSARRYTSNETISFSQSPRTHLPDVDREMTFHLSADHVQVSNLTQAEFDAFVMKYADRYKSIYFSHNPMPE